MRSLLFALSLATFAGCANYARPVVAPSGPTTADERNFQAVWQASLDVLRRYGFEVDPPAARQDRRDGLIVTPPLVGRQWFECWRRDAAGAHDVTETSLQTIFRTATVRVSRTAPNAGTFRADVEVQVVRADRLSPQIASASDIYEMFVMPGVEKHESKMILQAKPVDPADQVSLGRDEKLESKMMNEIQAKAQSQRAGGIVQSPIKSTTPLESLDQPSTRKTSRPATAPISPMPR